MSSAGIVDVEVELDKLRDFQRRTAEYAFRRMFEDDDCTTRFLVADEVGLGKTFVAKGVVAQVLDKLGSIGDKRHDIVYICSNAAIARQNIRKLVPSSISSTQRVDRLSMLLHPDYQPGSGADAKVNLVALTPATSFKMGNRSGRIEERVLAAALLSALWNSAPLATAAARRIFWHPVKGAERQKQLHRQAKDLLDKLNARASSRARKGFATEVRRTNERRKREGQPSLKVAFNRLVEQSPKRSDGKLTSEANESRLKFIRDVRHAMARAGISLLNPDLVILDEFQRFKDLLDPDEEHQSEVTEHAQAFFSHRDDSDPDKDDKYRQVRCLLLSATPYKSYSTADESDDHYEDFVDTCRFLFDDENRTEEVKHLLCDLRRSLRSVGDAARRQLDLSRGDGSGGTTLGAAGEALDDARGNDTAVREGTDSLLKTALAAAHQQCEELSNRLSQVMSRTERLAATPDRSGMLAEREAESELLPDDIRAYVQLGSIADQLRLTAGPAVKGQAAHRITDPMEFWKSSPYTLNFMGRDDYAIKRAFREQAERGDLASFDPGGAAMLDWGDVEGYEAIDPCNPRLRWLIEDLDRRDAFEVLWIPPSLPYYRAGTSYDSALHSTDAGTGAGEEASAGLTGLTKRLVFSAWRVVPRAVSSLVSYEAERRTIGEVRGSTAGDVSADRTVRDGAVKYTSERARHGGGNLTLTRRSIEGSRGADAEGHTRETRAAAMSSLQFMLPSPALAELGYPRIGTGGRFIGPARPLADLRAQVAERIAGELRPLLHAEEQAALDRSLAHAMGAPAGDGSLTPARRGDMQWYWLAPLLLDVVRSPDRFGPWSWWSADDLVESVVSDEEAGSRRNARSTGEHDAVADHVNRAWKLLIAELHRRQHHGEAGGEARTDTTADKAGPSTRSDGRRSGLKHRLESALRDAGADQDEMTEWFAVPMSEADRLGELPEDLVAVLTDFAIGGPAICALRSLAAVLGGASDTSAAASTPLAAPAMLAAAAHIGAAFRSLFNSPEAAALVNRSAEAGGSESDSPAWPYWRKAVAHCVDGHLGALLDEHTHVLRDWLGHPAPLRAPRTESEKRVGAQPDEGGCIDAAHSDPEGAERGWAGRLCASCPRAAERRRRKRGQDSGNDGEHCVHRAVCDVSAKIAEALRIQTSTITIDTPAKRSDGRIVTSDDGKARRGRAKKASHTMRHRFAVAYGTQQTDDSGAQRDEHVSAAFNSPFWPFVLTSTSVGQEGLDFHLWCHAVVHWNLPSNPVDLEQREGRVHRYKNHAVRRNLASALGTTAIADTAVGEDVWERLFQLGSSGRDEMVPCWVYPGRADDDRVVGADTDPAKRDAVETVQTMGREASVASDEAPPAAVARIERWVPMLPLSCEETQLARLRRMLGAYRLAIGQPRQEELLEYLSRAGALDDEIDSWLASELAKVRIDLTPPPRPD